MSLYQSDLTRRTLVEFTLPAGTIDAAHLVATQVTDAVRALGMSPARLEQIIRAVSEAVQNTLRQGHRFGPDLPLKIQVFADESADQGALCCWGFFLIARTADRWSGIDGMQHPVIQLFLYQEGIQQRGPTS